MRAISGPGSRRSHIGDARLGAAAALWWVLPALAILGIYFSPRHIVSAGAALAGLLALGVVAIAAQRPDRALLLLIALLPFQGLLLSKLWAYGISTSAIKYLGAWKELLAVGVILAGARNFTASGRRADALDRLGLSFVALAALYLALQPQIIPSAPSSMSVRLLGFREDAGFVLVLLGARHAALPPGFLDRAMRVAIAVSVIVAGIAIFEAIDSSAWNQFVVQTMKYTRYQIQVLNIYPQDPNDIRYWGTIGGIKIARPGSVFLNPLVCGFYLVLAFAVALEKTLRRQGGGWALAALALGAGILVTQTRSAILAALIVGFLGFQPARGRGWQWRTQLAIAAAALALIAIPTAFATGLAERVQITSNTQDVSTAGHIAGFSEGLAAIGNEPLGHGLGTSAGTGQRFNSNVVTPENNYLQFGVELGVLPMLLFVALTVTLVVWLRRAARGSPLPPVTAAWATVSGLAAGAWFLHTWIDFSVAWTVWGMAGAALGVAARQHLSKSAVAEGR